MKTIKIKVIPKSKKNSIEKIGEIFCIHTTAPAVDGKANEAVLLGLARFLGVKSYEIKIIRGLKSREKILEII